MHLLLKSELHKYQSEFAAYLRGIEAPDKGNEAALKLFQRQLKVVSTFLIKLTEAVDRKAQTIVLDQELLDTLSSKYSSLHKKVKYEEEANILLAMNVATILESNVSKQGNIQAVLLDILSSKSVPFVALSNDSSKKFSEAYQNLEA